ncbi:MAG: hypothetical protein ACTSPB_05125 [Candidatus Thorarchaeota archaeon]
MKILVDLDGTLSIGASYPDIGKPNKEVVDALYDLKNDGYEIVVFTTRTWWEEKEIMRWCVDVAKFVPDGILCSKPLGIIIDDLSVNPRDGDVLKRTRDLIRRFKSEWMNASSATD